MRGSTAYKQILQIVIPSLVFWFLVEAVLVAVLVSNRGRTTQRSFKLRFYYLIDGLRPNRITWEVLQHLQKIVLILVNNLYNSNQNERNQISLLVLFFSFVLERSWQPYLNRRLRQLSYYQSIVFIVSMLIKTWSSNGNYKKSESALLIS